MDSFLLGRQPSRMGRSYGWRPSLPHAREPLVVQALLAGDLPRKFSLRKGFPRPYDQEQLGSCTANEAAAILAFRLIKEGKLTITRGNTPAGVPSRLMIYWLERYLEGTVPTDSGASITDGVLALKRWGACFEDTWSYDISKFTVRPSTLAFQKGTNQKVKKSLAVDGADLLAQKTAIFQNNPIGFGFTVYESFEDDAVARTGLMPMPNVDAEQVLGGHAVVRMGWNDDLQVRGNDGRPYLGAWECRNSWGEWGDHGYFYMPYAFGNSPSFCADFQTILLV